MLKTAYVFPGQGSQFIGMLSELACHYPIITDSFDVSSERVGYDVWSLVQQGPVDRLNQTEHTQVAMLTADVALFYLMKQVGAPVARMMAGHSLGEYAALVCANAISLSDAAALVAMRGRVMQEAVPLGEGAMAAIVGLSDDAVRDVCVLASTEAHFVSPANYNAIGQVVIAGHVSAVDKALFLADEMGARLTMRIPVSVPCHCPLLLEACERFDSHLQQTSFNIPELPVISNVDLSVYESVDQIRRLLKEQLYRPVRWVETIQLMKHSGIDLLIECGPGKVLSGLIKRIDKTIQTCNVHDKASLNDVTTRI